MQVISLFCLFVYRYLLFVKLLNWLTLQAETEIIFGKPHKIGWFLINLNDMYYAVVLIAKKKPPKKYF